MTLSPSLRVSEASTAISSSSRPAIASPFDARRARNDAVCYHCVSLGFCGGGACPSQPMLARRMSFEARLRSREGGKPHRRRRAEEGQSTPYPPTSALTPLLRTNQLRRAGDGLWVASTDGFPRPGEETSPLQRLGHRASLGVERTATDYCLLMAED